MLEKTHSVRVANEFLKDEFKGANGIDILLESDGSIDRKMLLNIEDFSNEILKHPQVSKVVGPINILKALNRSIEGKSEQYQVPETDGKVDDIINVFSFFAPDEMDKWISSKKDYMRMHITWNVNGSSESLILIKYLKKKLKEFNITGTITGKSALMVNTNTYLVDIFSKSILFAISAIFLIMLLTFRSIKIALLSLIPNIGPILIGLGLMYYLKISIDFGSVMVASVCLGVAIDDTIHFIFKLQKNKKENENIEAATVLTLANVGRALVVTTVILSLSFASFLLGEIRINRNFGILSIIMLNVALIFDLVLLPAIFILDDKLSFKLKKLLSKDIQRRESPPA